MLRFGSHKLLSMVNTIATSHDVFGGYAVNFSVSSLVEVVDMKVLFSVWVCLCVHTSVQGIMLKCTQ